MKDDRAEPQIISFSKAAFLRFPAANLPPSGSDYIRLRRGSPKRPSFGRELPRVRNHLALPALVLFPATRNPHRGANATASQA